MPVGSLLYAEKPGQALSKDVFGSAAAADVQVKAPGRGTGSASGDARETGMAPGIPSLASDKKKRAEASLENSTGPRKRLGQLGGLPGPGSPNRGRSERRRAGAANSVGGRALRAAPRPKALSLLQPAPPSPEPATGGSSDANAPHHLNRAGKAMPYKGPDPSRRVPKPSWVTNRWSPSSMHLGGLRKGKGRAAQSFPKAGAQWGETSPEGPCCPSGCAPVVDGDKEEVCLTECRKERDEVEAFCASEFGRWYPPQPIGTEHLLSPCH